MKLVALCGLHGAGKDTVADALPARMEGRSHG